MSTH
jgi:hypothetical protein